MSCFNVNTVSFKCIDVNLSFLHRCLSDYHTGSLIKKLVVEVHKMYVNRTLMNLRFVSISLRTWSKDRWWWCLSHISQTSLNLKYGSWILPISNSCGWYNYTYLISNSIEITYDFIIEESIFYRTRIRFLSMSHTNSYVQT